MRTIGVVFCVILIFVLVPTARCQESILIHVVDEDNEPLIDAHVYSLLSRDGALTDENGKVRVYRSMGEIEVSFVGKQKYQIDLTSRNQDSICVRLKDNNPDLSYELDEVQVLSRIKEAFRKFEKLRYPRNYSTKYRSLEWQDSILVSMASSKFSHSDSRETFSAYPLDSFKSDYFNEVWANFSIEGSYESMRYYDLIDGDVALPQLKKTDFQFVAKLGEEILIHYRNKERQGYITLDEKDRIVNFSAAYANKIKSAQKVLIRSLGGVKLLNHSFFVYQSFSYVKSDLAYPRLHYQYWHLKGDKKGQVSELFLYEIIHGINTDSLHSDSNPRKTNFDFTNYEKFLEKLGQ